MRRIPYKIILTGGGTGGHIFPALAMARYLQKKDAKSDILFVGAIGGMEEKLVPREGFPLEVLPVKGLPRSVSLKLIKASGSFLVSLKEAGRIIKSFNPDAVIGTGGYAAGPLMLRALLGKYPTMLHEQNIVPGLTNRKLAPLVDTVCLSFEESKKYFSAKSRVVYTGNPRASEMARIPVEKAKAKLGFHPGKPLLVVVGGSRGAAVLNQVFLEYLLYLNTTPGFQILYITGETYYQKACKELEKSKVVRQGDNLKVSSFYEDMPLVWSAADLAICRSGATTLAEITAAGVPAMLVPSPNVVHDHQALNAGVLEEQGAALVIKETDFNSSVLKGKIDELFRYPVLLRDMKENSLKLGVPDAAERMYHCLQEIINKGK